MAEVFPHPGARLSARSSPLSLRGPSKEPEEERLLNTHVSTRDRFFFLFLLHLQERVYERGSEWKQVGEPKSTVAATVSGDGATLSVSWRRASVRLVGVRPVS